MLRAVGVELHALGIILGERRVVAADALDEAAVARAARIGDDDLVIRTLFRTAACEANGGCHDIFLQSLTFNSGRSEEHTSELQSLMRISYAVFCLKKTKQIKYHNTQY